MKVPSLYLIFLTSMYLVHSDSGKKHFIFTSLYPIIHNIEVRLYTQATHAHRKCRVAFNEFLLSAYYPTATDYNIKMQYIPKENHYNIILQSILQTLVSSYHMHGKCKSRSPKSCFLQYCKMATTSHLQHDNRPTTD